MADEPDQEIELEIAGQKARAKGYRLVDLLWLPLVAGVLYCCLMLYQSAAAAQVEKNVTAKALLDSNANVTAALKDSNKAMVEAIKEANDNTVRALNGVTIELKRTTKAMKENACLSDPALKNRMDARDVCRRLSRDDS